MSDHNRKYTNGEITVVWKPKQCMHSGICFAGMGNVFNPRRRPWVDLSGASTEAIVAQVKQCPSGALSIEQGASPGAGAVEVDAVIEVTPDGPLLVRGNVQVNGADGSQSALGPVTALCRCGQSSKKPFCDGTHRKVGFKG